MKSELYKKYVERMNSTNTIRAMFRRPELVRRAALTVFLDRKEAENRVVSISNIRASK